MDKNKYIVGCDPWINIDEFKAEQEIDRQRSLGALSFIGVYNFHKMDIFL